MADIREKMRKHQLQWFGHLTHRMRTLSRQSWGRRLVTGRGMGRPNFAWEKRVKKNMGVHKKDRNLVGNRCAWKIVIHQQDSDNGGLSVCC